PEDMLVEAAAVADAPRYRVRDAVPSEAQMQSIARRLKQARQPLAILGGSRWNEEAVARFQEFATAWNLPVAVQFRRQMLFPVDHPNFIGDIGLGGNPQLLQFVRDSDLILMVGGRFSEIPSQSYTLLDIPSPSQQLVHVHPDSSELNRVYIADEAVNVSPTSFCEALAKLDTPTQAMLWVGKLSETRASYEKWTDTSAIRHAGALQMAQVMQHLNEVLPADAIMCNGAGNYVTWLHRFRRFTRFGTQLAPTSGSMGYGLPAAVGAKRLYPERTVVCMAGDGCFMMHGQEFATAVQYDLPIIVLIIDNGMYGTIRMHQERHYPGRISATTLKDPDFAAYAQAFGGHGERVETTEQFAPALERAMASGKPAILHCLLDPEAITPAQSLTAIREQALKA